MNLDWDLLNAISDVLKAQLTFLNKYDAMALSDFGVGSEAQLKFIVTEFKASADAREASFDKLINAIENVRNEGNPYMEIS